MASYDVFNGDADGLCALQQLRLAEPRDAVLVTGLKREIELLRRVDAAPGDDITVLDVSLDSNRGALVAALAADARVFYADHHYAGDIPEHPDLEAHIDTAGDTCTSLIVDRVLGGTAAPWAVVGAFGDNLDAPARALGESLGFDAPALASLQQLGVCLNYNGYGFDLDDLLFHPADLYRRVAPHADPLEFAATDAGYAELRAQYENDLALASGARADTESPAGAVYLLPNEAWARRIVGVMGNDLAKRDPDRAHALLVDMGDGFHRVSVRAPYNRKHGADELCRRFPSGGGRKAAAGINRLAADALPEFIDSFNRQFGDAA